MLLNIVYVSLFFSSFPLDKNQYFFLLVRGCKATAGVGSPVRTDEEGRRTDYLGLIFSQILRGMWHYSLSIGCLVLCPLISRWEAAEFLVQVDWLLFFFSFFLLAPYNSCGKVCRTSYYFWIKGCVCSNKRVQCCVMYTYLNNTSYFRTKLEILRRYLI